MSGTKPASSMQTWQLGVEQAASSSNGWILSSIVEVTSCSTIFTGRLNKGLTGLVYASQPYWTPRCHEERPIPVICHSSSDIYCCAGFHKPGKRRILGSSRLAIDDICKSLESPSNRAPIQSSLPLSQNSFEAKNFMHHVFQSTPNCQPYHTTLNTLDSTDTAC